MAPAVVGAAVGRRGTRGAAGQLLALLALGLAAPLHAQDAAGVTPYRPSAASPAQLPAAGQLEFETGALRSQSGDGRRDSMPYLLKLAFDQQWGVLIGGEALVRQCGEDGRCQRGGGDTSLVLKHAFAAGAAGAYGLELGVKLPTARDGIGSGKSDVSLNGIASRDLGALHLDVNLNAARLGGDEAGAGRLQTGWAAAFSVPLAAQWGAVAEVSGSRRRGRAHAAQLLLAASYSPHPRLTFDLGAARGLGRSSQDWSLFSGLVLPLGRFR